jgi:serine/threonine-protein kinase
LREPDEQLLRNRLALIRQMAEGVQAVHDAGFIHRDICPRNFICFNDYTWLKLIDFGLTVPNTANFRLAGNRTGTPQYMAPEIIRRRPTDERVDIFAFGVTIYRFLALEHPWGSTDVTAMAALSHDQKPAEDICKYRPNLNQKLVKAVHRCLEINPDKRFSSIKQFLTSISGVNEEDS